MFWQLKLHNKSGATAENRALNYFKARGMKLINRNYACKAGEIDLIMLDKNVLVFIEVRLRSSSRFGSAADSITPAKQHKLRKAAQHFLVSHPEHQQRFCRFDALLFKNSSGQPDANPEKPIEWLQNIF
ncbi:YraN family protein [Endozoicomonas arenosclerae]|uniref:YraN family protein n=1 Tax=Endozoicomonas arenosclerae TaxID=1633495 RepID=UPI0009A1B925|nr:YraN family protein [Endozoicomonas arenosclerae]